MEIGIIGTGNRDQRVLGPFAESLGRPGASAGNDRAKAARRSG